MVFLRAKWERLAFFNYAVDPMILAPYVPYGTELDLWEERCLVSVVGFMFLDVAVLGLKIPFHTNFEEVNLRFYVKRWENNEWKRGVVFIKEIVPKAAITFVANTLYKENYQTNLMRHSWTDLENEMNVKYEWKLRNGLWNFIEIHADQIKSPILVGSDIEFITEHYWGYAQVSARQTNEYNVEHPRWTHHKVQSFKVNIDFESNYGKTFAHLHHLEPSSVMLASGSEILVKNKTTIRV
jgi:uncharacterized protein